MKIIVKDFTDENTNMVYPCLLQHIPDHLEPDETNDIILAISSDGNLIKGIVLANYNELNGFSVGETIERYFQKKHYRPYHGEVVISN